MPVKAVRLVRRMRGGAQAHLLEADDGCFYVVKFKNNPQHRRILVNEWIASAFLRYLQIATPPAALVEVDGAFLAKNPEVHLQLGNHRSAVEPGWHFGSQFPGSPDRTSVYDFLPDVLLPKVGNQRDFLGVFLFDKWTANADSRQSIFYRAVVRTPAGELEPGKFVAVMVDQGYAFDGPNWSFGDSPIQGLYHRRSVYSQVQDWHDFEPWLGRLKHFPEEVVDQAWREIPPDWLRGEESELERLLTRLMDRRSRIEDLVHAVRQQEHIRPFPNWRK